MSKDKSINKETPSKKEIAQQIISVLIEEFPVPVYVFDINQPSLPTPFYSVLLFQSLWPFQLYFIP